MRHHKSSIVYTCTNRIYRPKRYFYVFLGNNFLLFFCGGPLVVEALGNCPVCPPLLNPALCDPLPKNLTPDLGPSSLELRPLRPRSTYHPVENIALWSFHTLSASCVTVHSMLRYGSLGRGFGGVV